VPLVLDFLFVHLKFILVNDATIETVRTELANVLVGQKLGKVFALSRRSIALDFRIPSSLYLFISVDPGSPRTYLIRRRLKDLESESGPPQTFHLLLKKYLSGADLFEIEKLHDERVLIFKFATSNDLGEAASLSLSVQLTGRSSNVLLLDPRGNVVGALVEKDTDGQRIGDKYLVPTRPEPRIAGVEGNSIEILAEDGGSISAALDRTYLQQESEERFRSRAETARREIERDISKRRKLIGRLNDDLKQHGEAEKWKRYGDLILANLSTARRNGSKLILTDYFDETAPQIEIDADENLSMTDAAQKYFKRYTKAQNAAHEIDLRSKKIERELIDLEAKWCELERAIEKGDEIFFGSGEVVGKPPKKSKKENLRFAGARQFTSSDGFEVLVGKKASDNDYLTFRVAGSLDLWLHAADYSGSHVVIRNPNRKEIPHRTLLESAQLAAFYSSGKSQTKAAVNYTQKKFVHKPKGAAPGLVRLASFKTILVEPVVPTAIDRKTR